MIIYEVQGIDLAPVTVTAVLDGLETRRDRLIERMAE